MQHRVDPIDQENAECAAGLRPEDQPAPGRIGQGFDGAPEPHHNEEHDHEPRVSLNNSQVASPTRLASTRIARELSQHYPLNGTATAFRVAWPPTGSRDPALSLRTSESGVRQR